MSDATTPPDETAQQLAELTSVAGTDGSGLKRVLFYGTLAGLCPLIPIPFIDDVLIKTLRKRMIRGQLRRAGLEPAKPQVNLITFLPLEVKLLGCVLGVAWYVIKKILRKLVYIFAIKDCVDNASEVVHHGWLVQYALASGTLGQHTFEQGNDAIKLVRDSVLETSENIDTRPFNQALKRFFRGSRSLVRSAARAAGRLLRAGGADRRSPDSVDAALDHVEQRRVGELEKVLDAMVRAIGGQQGYLRQLEAAFDETYARMGEERAAEAAAQGNQNE